MNPRFIARSFVICASVALLGACVPVALEGESSADWSGEAGSGEVFFVAGGGGSGNGSGSSEEGGGEVSTPGGELTNGDFTNGGSIYGGSDALAGGGLGSAGPTDGSPSGGGGGFNGGGGEPPPQLAPPPDGSGSMAPVLAGTCFAEYESRQVARIVCARSFGVQGQPRTLSAPASQGELDVGGGTVTVVLVPHATQPFQYFRVAVAAGGTAGSPSTAADLPSVSLNTDIVLTLFESEELPNPVTMEFRLPDLPVGFSAWQSAPIHLPL